MNWIKSFEIENGIEWVEIDKSVDRLNS